MSSFWNRCSDPGFRFPEKLQQSRKPELCSDAWQTSPHYGAAFAAKRWRAKRD